MGRVRWWSTGALCGLALLPGCLELETTVTFGKDGTGTQEIAMTMSEATLADLRRAAAANQTAAADPSALFVRASVEPELTSAGLELVRHASKTEDGARTVSLLAKFAQPAILRQSPLSGTAAEWSFKPGPVAGTIEVTLWPQGRAAWAEARSKAAAMQTTADPVAAEFFKKREAQLAGLDVTVRFKLPGKVLRYTANLEQTDACTVAARITGDRIRTPEDLVRRLAPRFQVVFDASDCQGFPLDQ